MHVGAIAGNGIKAEESGFLKNAGVPDQEVQVILANKSKPIKCRECRFMRCTRARFFNFSTGIHTKAREKR